MKNIIILSFVIALTGCSNQTPNTDSIAKALTAYVSAADDQNTEILQEILHPEYRALANRIFESDKLQVLSKELYLSLINDGTIGGDKRKIEIIETEVIGHNAFVRATLTGHDHIFNTFILLAQSANGDWKIVSDMPQMEKLY